MRIIVFLFVSFLMVSCSELIDPPENLISKKDMSEIIADFALNDQLPNHFENYSMENGTRYILKQKKITAADFNESYKFYIASGELDGILDNAQEIIIEKDPAAAKYIQKKIKENQNQPELAR